MFDKGLCVLRILLILEQNPVILFWKLDELIVCSYVTYTFQSESKLYSCLNVKELPARNRRKMWSLSDCNRTRTHNHLVCKRTLNHLAKLVFNHLAKVFVYKLSGCGVESHCSHLMNWVRFHDSGLLALLQTAKVEQFYFHWVVPSYIYHRSILLNFYVW